MPFRAHMHPSAGVSESALIVENVPELVSASATSERAWPHDLEALVAYAAYKCRSPEGSKTEELANEMTEFGAAGSLGK